MSAIFSLYLKSIIGPKSIKKAPLGVPFSLYYVFSINRGNSVRFYRRC